MTENLPVQAPSDSPIPFEYRVVGPPGCGKTTWLAQQVTANTEEGRHVLVTSLTKAAAAELDETHTLYPDQLATLHSHAFNALGRPQLAHTKTAIEAWNEENPHLRLAESQNQNADAIDKDNISPAHGSPGNHLLELYQWFRARRKPLEAMPDQVRSFAGRWNAYKRDNAILDYTDLIEVALTDTDQAPGSPDVLFADESQDFDFLEMALLRRWGAAASSLIAVGDPDQNLYSFRGSDPRAFTSPALPREQWHTLSQSYRVPRAVHRQALQWINRQTDRHQVSYQPRDATGMVLTSEATWRHPDPLMPELKNHLAEGKRIMLIASASYMVDPLIDLLRFHAIPFHNPQRRSNGRWNPIPSRSNATNAAQRLHAFLKLSETGSWTADDVRAWTHNIKVSEVSALRNAKTFIQDLENDDTDFEGQPALSVDTIMQIFPDQTMDAAYSGDLDWYSQHLTSAAKKSSVYPLEIARTWGPATLTATPQAIVGTCHSVKGGEADVVYLFPDLSQSGLREWGQGEGQNAGSVYRLFYVGMTRARETLVICSTEEDHHPNLQY